MEPFLGQLMLFAGNFAPRGWAFCNGQLMSIAQNTALFSILGTTYGGDGITTFALPDLRGRSPVAWGQGPGLSSFSHRRGGGHRACHPGARQHAHPHPHRDPRADRRAAGEQSPG
jgi:microcystin-dependent protein